MVQPDQVPHLGLPASEQFQLIQEKVSKASGGNNKSRKYKGEQHGA